MNAFRVTPLGDGFELQERRHELMTCVYYYIPTGIRGANLAKMEEICALLNLAKQRQDKHAEENPK